MLNYKKILIFSRDIPQLKNAGSILLYRLFREYETSKLLIIGPELDEKFVKLNCKYYSQKFWIHKLLNSRFYSIINILISLVGAKFIAKVSSKNKKTIREFYPDMVISVMLDYPYYFNAYRIAKKYNIPLHLICHDDVEDFMRLKGIFRTLMVTKNKKIYRFATTKFVVSPEMGNEFRIRYETNEYSVLYPNRDEKLRPRPVNYSKNLRKSPTLVIGYAGSLNYGYDLQLKSMLPAFYGTNTLLFIYADKAMNHLENCSFEKTVVFKGYSPDPLQTWEKIKEECDAVILPYCFNENGDYELYKTHFPSKLTEYLALGLPVIITGPQYATGVKWGLAHPDASITINTFDLKKYENAFIELKNNDTLRIQLSSKANVYAVQEFDPVKIRELFFSKLAIR